MIPIPLIRKTVLRLGMVLPVAVLLATIWVTRETSGQFDAAFASVTHTYKVLNILEETQSRIGDTETGQRGYILTGQADYFSLYGASLAAVNNNVQELKILFQGDSIQEKNLNQLQNLVAQRLALNPTNAAFAKTHPASEVAVALTDQGRDTMSQLRSVLFRMREQETDLLVVRQQDAESKFLFDQTALFVLVGITAIALIAIVAILLQIEHLRQIVTICAWTGQVKHEGEWIRLEDYLKLRFGLSVSHGLSKEAAESMTREIRKAKTPPNPP